MVLWLGLGLGSLGLCWLGSCWRKRISVILGEEGTLHQQGSCPASLEAVAVSVLLHHISSSLAITRTRGTSNKTQDTNSQLMATNNQTQDTDSQLLDINSKDTGSQTLGTSNQTQGTSNQLLDTNQAQDISQPQGTSSLIQVIVSQA